MHLHELMSDVKSDSDLPKKQNKKTYEYNILKKDSYNHTSNNGD